MGNNNKHLPDDFAAWVAGNQNPCCRPYTDTDPAPEVGGGAGTWALVKPTAQDAFYDAIAAQLAH
jgi:hypothetical protein